jgi:hypothetical protein
MIEIHDLQICLTTYFITMLGITSHPQTKLATRKALQIFNVLIVCGVAWVVFK